MKKIGVIGLGNISQKAYLPVMAEMNDQVEWHFYTRNQEKLATICKKYHFEYQYSSITALIESGIEAAFVHTATPTHAEIIELLLNEGIHVYVDKPISEDIRDTARLLQLAEEKNLILMTGFNRRFAPFYQDLAAIPDKNMIIMEKNRVNTIKENQYAIYDDFIHVVDTMCYLLGDDITHFSVHKKLQGEFVSQVMITIHTETTTGIAISNFKAGANREWVEVMTPSATYQVENMVELKILTKNDEKINGFSDWTSTLEKRGFVSIIEAFVESLDTLENPISIQDTIVSHDICHKIVQKESV